MAMMYQLEGQKIGFEQPGTWVAFLESIADFSLYLLVLKWSH